MLGRGCRLSGRRSSVAAPRPLGPPRRQLAHPRRHVRTGPQLGHDLLDLALGLVGGALQEGLSVPGRQVRGQQRDAAQVNPPVAEHLEEHRVLATRPRHVDPQRGLGLREMQHLDAVGVHGGRGLPGVEPARVHLGDEGDEVGLDAAGLLQHLGQAAQQIVVRHGLETRCSPSWPKCRRHPGHIRSAASPRSATLRRAPGGARILHPNTTTLRRASRPDLGSGPRRPGPSPAAARSHALPGGPNFAGVQAQPALSPDGRSVAFVSNRDGDFHIYVGRSAGASWSRSPTVRTSRRDRAGRRTGPRLPTLD